MREIFPLVKLPRNLVLGRSLRPEAYVAFALFAEGASFSCWNRRRVPERVLNHTAYNLLRPQT